ncbi:hypothetical protein ACFL2B_02825 [Patescibacteria group bacterium]
MKEHIHRGEFREQKKEPEVSGSIAIMPLKSTEKISHRAERRRRMLLLIMGSAPELNREIGSAADLVNVISELYKKYPKIGNSEFGWLEFNTQNPQESEQVAEQILLAYVDSFKDENIVNEIHVNATNGSSRIFIALGGKEETRIPNEELSDSFQAHVHPGTVDLDDFSKFEKKVVFGLFNKKIEDRDIESLDLEKDKYVIASRILSYLHLAPSLEDIAKFSRPEDKGSENIYGNFGHFKININKDAVPDFNAQAEEFDNRERFIIGNLLANANELFGENINISLYPRDKYKELLNKQVYNLGTVKEILEKAKITVVT